MNRFASRMRLRLSQLHATLRVGRFLYQTNPILSIFYFVHLVQIIDLAHIHSRDVACNVSTSFIEWEIA